MKNRPVGLRSGHRQFLFLSSSTSPCNRRNCFHCGIFNSHLSFFFPFGAIYRVGCRGLGVDGGRWSCLVPYQSVGSGVGVLGEHSALKVTRQPRTIF